MSFESERREGKEGKVEGDGAVRQERKVMAYAFSCYVTQTMGGQWRVLTSMIAMKLEGKKHVDRRHSLTSRVLRRRQSIPIHMRVIKIHIRFKITVHYDMQTRNPKNVIA